MKRITFVLALLLLCVGQFAYAQTIKVTGTVTDAATNEPLYGAGVMVKGTTSGVATDANGQYVINVRRDAVLVVSYQGYTTQEVPINGRSVINVALQEDATMLETTIVVGYGSARKISSVVGSAETVKAKALKDKPIINAGDALQGTAAGLQVYTSSGDPAANVSMRIRGVNSLNASTDPLIVLDGNPVLSSIFQTLNAGDIESVTVLKDASATAIYGSRAANGVVYITTKKGTTDKPTVKVGFNYGISSLAKQPIKSMNSAEWFAMHELVDPSSATDPDFQALKNFRLSNNIGTNWKKWILNNNAPTIGGEVSVSGRTTNTDYYVSLVANRQVGVQPETSMNRYSARVNINTRATNWFKFGINLNLSFQQRYYNGYNSDYSSARRNNWYNPMNIAFWSVPWWTVREIKYDAAGNFAGYGDELEFITDKSASFRNAKTLYKDNLSRNSYIRLNGNIYEEFSPVKGLIVRFSQALEGYDYRFTNKYLFGKIFDAGSTSADETFTRYYRLTSSNTAEYKVQFGEKHNFSVLVGQEAIINNSNGFGAGSEGQTDRRLWAVNQGTKYNQPSYSYSQYKYNSIFSRLSYDYASKYYIDATYRRDGSSLFGADNRYANFWSVGAMWNMKREKFFEDVTWLDKLQLSSSYGTVGNSGIDNYLSIGVVSATTQYNGKRTWYLGTPGNSKLTWETLRTFNVALDFRIFNRFETKIEFYDKMTRDMLLEIPWSYATGFDGGWGNVGNMVNRGIEATFTYDFIRTNNTFLQASLNVAYNKDKITKLFDGRDEFRLPDYGLCYKVGKSAGDIWYVKSAGVDPANGRPLWYDKDGNVTDTYPEDDRVHLGQSRYAPWSAGLSIDFSWKQLTFQAQFSGMFEKYMINNDRFFFTRPLSITGGANGARELLYETWTTPGQIAKYPAPKHYLDSTFDSRLVENASFVRLKGVTISYSLNKNALSKLGGVLTGVRFYVTGRNLLTFTKYTGWDPEPNTNLSLAAYPNTKQYSAGIELTF